MGSSAYTVEAFRKVFVLLKVMNLWKEKFMSSPVEHPKLDSSLLLGEEHHRIYQKLVGIAE